jgi:hypothetical protein
MANKVGYEVEGNVVANLKELADLLGVEKVNKKDIEDGGQYHDIVGIVDLSSADSEEADTPKKPQKVKEDVNKDEVYTALSEEDMKNLEDPSVAEEIKSEFPEFENIDELKEFIKDIDTPTLEYMATGMGLEWNPTYHANIHRMRIAMAIQKHFFPELFQPKESKKKKAKYGDYSTDDLFSIAEEGKIEVKRSGNDPIDRMRVIMKLKEQGILVD